MDQLMNSSSTNEPRTLAIALGANLPSHVRPPHKTLIALRPALQEEINNWISKEISQLEPQGTESNELRFRWSPLYGTEPIGGPAGQAEYVNAVVVVDGQSLSKLKPSKSAAFSGSTLSADRLGTSVIERGLVSMCVPSTSSIFEAPLDNIMHSKKFAHFSNNLLFLISGEGIFIIVLSMLDINSISSSSKILVKNFILFF